MPLIGVIAGSVHCRQTSMADRSSRMKWVPVRLSAVTIEYSERPAECDGTAHLAQLKLCENSFVLCVRKSGAF